MIKLQNVPRLSVFNFTQQAAPQRNASINNNLERSPQRDSISFTSKIKKEEPEEILPIIDLDAADVVELDDADIVSVDESTDFYELEEQERRLREEREEDERRQREEQELNDDMLFYGAVLPSMAIVLGDVSDAEDTSFDDPLKDSFNNDDLYPQDDDFSSFDDGLNDFDDFGF